MAVRAAGARSRVSPSGRDARGRPSTEPDAQRTEASAPAHPRTQLCSRSHPRVTPEPPSTSPL